jgi:hypothetical protein
MNDTNHASNDPGEFDYFKIISQATKAVPFVKYALGLSGLLALISLTKITFRLGYVVAVWGVVIILVLMTILFLLAKASQTESILKGPSQVLLWAIVIIFILTIACLFTSVFFKYPADLRKWIDPDVTIKNNQHPLKGDSVIYKLDSESLKTHHKKSTGVLPEETNKRHPQSTTISIQLKSETDGYKLVYYNGVEVPTLPESTAFNPRITIDQPGGRLTIITRQGDTCFAFIPKVLDSSITRIIPNCNLK